MDAKSDLEYLLREKSIEIGHLKKELEIEAALERVRSRSMAMLKSEELLDLVKKLYKEIEPFGVSTSGITISLFREEENAIECWFADNLHSDLLQSYKVVGRKNKVFNQIWEDWKNKNPQRIVYLEGEDKKDYDNYVLEETDFRKLPEELKQNIHAHNTVCFTFSYFRYGYFESVDLTMLSEENAQILLRFAKVFEQTYTRFLDLQKAEAQAKEAEIELALERVRARTMAMHKSEELGEVAILLYKEFNSLGIGKFFNCGFVIVNEDEKVQNGWLTQPEGTFIEELNLPYPGDTILKKRLKAWKERIPVFHQKVEGKVLKVHQQYVKDRSLSKNAMKSIIPFMPDPCHFYCGNFDEGYLHIIAKDELLTEAETILSRFTKIFSQTYTRFLDLQKAETQAREAEIEVSLERVRSSSMAMHSAEELASVSSVVYIELNRLGITNFQSCGFHIIDEPNEIQEVWNFHIDHKQLTRFQMPLKGNDILEIRYQAWKKSEKLFHQKVGGQQLNDNLEYITSKEIKLGKASSWIEKYGFPDPVHFHFGNFSKGYLHVISEQELSEEHRTILGRFAKVFEQTYTRFLDLQKAEAQAKEAEIELALERIRARTMAMQKTEELSEVIAVVFEQLTAMGFTSEGCDIIIYDREKLDAHYWFAGFEKGSDPMSYLVPYHEHPYYQSQIKGWKNGEKYKAIIFEGDLKKRFDDHVFTKTGFKNFPESRKKLLKSLKYTVVHDAFMSHGIVETIDLKPITDEKVAILQRIAKVFEQTYTRFLDLQKAETQAKEAEIELALERVRARTMAMQKSDELSEVAALLFRQLKILGADLWTAVIAFCKEDELLVEKWGGSPITDQMFDPLFIPYNADHGEQSMYDTWKNKIELYSYIQDGKELKDIYDHLMTIPSFKASFQKVIDAGRPLPVWQKNHVASYKYGYLLIVTEEEFEEEYVFTRFAKVFEQTYTRFLDLQKAEAQAKEAEIELALERVRSRTMAMHKSSELNEVSVLLYKELMALSVSDFFNCGYVELLEKEKVQYAWLTRDDGTFLGKLELPLKGDQILNARYGAWKMQKSLFYQELNSVQLKKHIAFISPQYNSKEADAIVKRFPNPTIFYNANFKHGYLHLNTGTYLDDEGESILIRFTQVFAQTYTRFLDLQKAEKQARESQIEAALERVRSRSMAMHQSEELNSVLSTMFSELTHLDFALARCVIWIFNEEDKSFKWYSANPEAEIDIYHIPYNNYKVISDYWEAWENRLSRLYYNLSGKLKIGMDDYLFNHTEMANMPMEVKEGMKKPHQIHLYNTCNDFGVLLVSSEVPQDDEILSILEKFGNVFNQAYTRFQDIQKAEAQAREAELELALERVRARTMAMQKSDELSEVAALLFKQLKMLGADLWSVVIAFCKEDELLVEKWAGSPIADQFFDPVFIPYNADHGEQSMYDTWKNKVELYSYIQEGKELKDIYDHLMTIPSFKASFQKVIDAGRPLPVWQKNHVVSYKYGYLLIVTEKEFEEEYVFSRFAKVFEQTYTRFLDLQKSEAQVREAEIQLALERVRARTMAMQKSDELGEVVYELFTQMNSTGFAEWGAAIALADETNHGFDVWFSTPYNPVSPERYFYPNHGHEVANTLWMTYENQNDLQIIELEHEQKTLYTQWLFENTNLGTMSEDDKTEILSQPYVMFSSGAMKYGLLEAVSHVPMSPELTKLLPRFAKVFEQTYTRFLDLQKAETQAREAQIEVGLERVRAKTMGMHSSNELLEIVDLLYAELSQLDVELARVVLLTVNPETLGMLWWMASPEKEIKTHGFLVPSNGLPMTLSMIKAWENKTSEWSYQLVGKDKKTYDKFLFTSSELSKLPEEVRIAMSAAKQMYVSGYCNNFGLLTTSTIEPLSVANSILLTRFGQVFEQTYTRFLDLQKAEAQTKEAQIEAALERVRSRSLAMHHTSEIQAVIHTVHEELLKLNISIVGGSFVVINNDIDLELSAWGAGGTADTSTEVFIPNFGKPFTTNLLKGIQQGPGFFTEEFTNQEKIEYFKALFELEPWSELTTEQKKEVLESKGGYTRSCCVLNHTSIFIINQTGRKFSEEDNDILKRFTRVFEQTYTRFLDLQKAETQAREAEIEAALERLRSRTMAMQKSEELLDAASLFYKELLKFGITNHTSGYVLMDAEEKIGWSYISNQMDGTVLPKPMGIPHQETEVMRSITKSWKRQEPFCLIQLNEKETITHQTFIAERTINFNLTAEELIAATPKRLALQTFNFKQGYLLIVGAEPLLEARIEILIRFAKVFEQTYTRFLDLQKAEAQAREAQIEAALERVRSRTMAMQKSEELSETSFLLDSQVRALGIKTWGCAFNIYQENDSMEWFGNEAGVLPKYIVPRVGIFKKYYDHGKKENSFYVQEIAGKECVAHYEFMSNLPIIGEVLKQLKVSNGSYPEYQIDHVAYFKYGYLLFITIEPVPEAHDIFKRFAKVFEQTYTRFLDLQKAEAQAKEATKQASLERVRGEIASMRSTTDLERITPLIWNELKTLGVPFIRCGVFIVNEQMEHVVVHLSSSEGQALGVLDLAFESNELTTKAIRSWRLDEVYHQHWNQEEFLNWTKLMIKAGQVKSKKTYQGMENAPESLDLHFIPFTQGMLYVGSVDALGKNEIDLVKSLADSFAIAYARYDDFIQLEKAKESIEITLSELKSTQKQLIQSEKMASLGELTAGIAHEIQNPLNFVNNFSEVTKELAEELEEEGEKGNGERDKELEKELIHDIKENLEKINHHGNRASSIVKGMLEHSRTSSGKKELTDINVLADECLRLSYHGLRAKDKDFNAEMVTNFDPTLPKIEVIPQDIGRVLLNLINNAFQAVSEEALKRKLKSYENADSYKPTVSIKTELTAQGQLLIAIKDNGPGIPDSIKDKIFQPFFTTKDTGKGTGLGLSLAYDIVKAHGGELNVQSIIGSGSSFTVKIPLKSK